MPRKASPGEPPADRPVLVGTRDLVAFGRRVYPYDHAVNLILRRLPPRIPAQELAARLKDVLAVADLE